jgi:chemotaxis protein methyltransferase CheR
LPATAIETNSFTMGPREFKLFRALIHERTGIYLRDTKQVMLAARLSKRMRQLGFQGFDQYYEYIQGSRDSGDELVQLINAVTTNKTSFFRENHHFNFLAGTVVPQIQAAAQHGAPKTIRVWSACCSTGEEPYSIAITLLEALQRAPAVRRPLPSYAKMQLPGAVSPIFSWKIEVVATDIDTDVLDKAQRANYRRDALDSVPQLLWKRYFLRGKDDMQGRVKVKPEVARLVHFQHLNLMDARWPLQGLFDVIFFRNALIYFNQDTQDVFLRKMARYLHPGGYLFLGNAEHIPWLHNIFEPLQQTMYRLR